jgi:tRNA A-37 threonylcarbamoyl transferase component Bud32/DNA-binding Lrp family transcriptional regulator
MSLSDKKSKTITWAKQFTTISQSGIWGRVLCHPFVNRNKKQVAVYLLIFLVIALSAHIFIGNLTEKNKLELFEKGTRAANNMGEKISSPLLGKDILSLNVAVGEMAKKNNPVFTAILDHDGKIIAHSDPDVIGTSYVFPENAQNLKVIDDISIDRLSYKDKPIIGFTKEILFSGIKIGKIIFGVDARQLDAPREKYNTLGMVIWMISIMGFILAVFFTDRYLKNKRAKELEAFKKADTVGPYRLTRKIAQGGMAELYLAEYTRGDGFKRAVAIKKILPHLVENQDFVDMFIREARLAALLQHPNIVQIFDLIKFHNANFIAMEFVEGKNLAEILAHEKKGLPVGLSIFLIQKISAGLYYSHTRKNADTGEPLNIVHRDVSPQNMLVSFKGEVKISDFGISKARSEPSFTQAGVIKGKLAYLSPEQALGKETDHQSDLYALGIIFYEILSGKRLYKFENELEALSALPKTIIQPIIEVRTDIPEKLNKIVMKCLEKDKTKRYQSGKQINDDLALLRKQLHISYDESNLVDFMTERFK